ncbi:MAG: DUF5694 domain-containing protein, partial [Thermoanaerobaculia bacterium]|nr:DUF5694 domain-containing protein [Thermoanaerobaculia bacterium]
MLRTPRPRAIRPPLIAVGFLLAHVGSFAAAGQDAEPALTPPKSKILLLGSFHFKDAGLDEYKPQHDVDILSPGRQIEVEEVVARLATWAPTKVAVERKADQQERLDREYALYRSGRWELRPAEAQQIGFRLAAAMDHSGVYAVDVEARRYEPWVDPDLWAREHDQGRLLDPLRFLEYDRISRWEDELKMRSTLREHLLHLNQPERLLRSHGIYLIGSFEAGNEQEYPGVD